MSAHSGCDFLMSLFEDCILEIFSIWLGCAKDWLSPSFQMVSLLHQRWAWPLAVAGPLNNFNYHCDNALLGGQVLTDGSGEWATWTLKACCNDPMGWENSQSLRSP